MRATILIFFSIVLSLGKLYSQKPLQFRAYSFSSCELKNGIWSDWTEPKLNSSVVTIDLENKLQIAIYSEVITEKFNVISSTTEENTNNLVLKCVCIDMFGDSVTITLFIEEQNKLFVDYGDYIEGYGLSRVLN